ncbi:MAG: hypothetical protein ACXU8R_17740, partial [Xanthobacteraceae bacterium]
SVPAAAYSPTHAEISAAPMAIQEAVSVMPGALALGCPGRTGASPGRKRIPFGPAHPALFIAYPDKNKGGIVLAGF